MRLPLELFEIEVSDTVLVGRGNDYLGAALRDLSVAGLRTTLDNFGAGASSLSQLLNLLLSASKIDDAFVKALDDPTDKLRW